MKLRQKFRLQSKKVQYTAVLSLIVILSSASAVAYMQVFEKTVPEITETPQPIEEQPIVEQIPVEEKPVEETKPTTTPPAPVVVPVSQWPVVYSDSEASSITVVVNKKHKLPSSYAPSVVPIAGGYLRQEAVTAMNDLLATANSAGNSMKIISSYRSYSTQVSTYQKWVNLQGQTEADRGSARPGHSEHQTGLAVDLGNPDNSCNLLACFGTGIRGVWLANNAHSFGFIVRYPEGKESLTGYQYEPWHVRYVGITEATAIYQSGQTMDQYYGVEAGGY